MKMDNARKKKGFCYANYFLFLLCFTMILVVDMFVQYSSGDDRLHRALAERCNLWEFIIQCETSRISKKISMYYIMRSDLIVWRVLNAIVFTLFFWEVSKLVLMVTCIIDEEKKFYIRFILLISIFLMHISIIGFAVFWVTGTQDYLWPCTFGILSLLLEIQYIYGKQINNWEFIAALFGALWGGLGQEQISFMLLCVSIYVLILDKQLNRKNNNFKQDKIFCYILLLIRIACFLFLILAPMNQKRLTSNSASAGFNGIILIKQILLTIQWELSAFSNELKSLYIAIWLILMINYYHSKSLKKFGITVALILATIPSFIGIPLLNDLGITTLTNMGITVNEILDVTQNAVSFSELTIMNWIGIIWWIIASMIITPLLLAKNRNCLFIYLMGIILPLMMVVSASMYLSGGRIFFVSGVLFCLVLGILLSKLSIKELPMIMMVFVLLGFYELGIDLSYFVKNLVNI